jgi:NADH:ubiquinone oxidoreductase subunit 6 (subunit J)
LIESAFWYDLAFWILTVILIIAAIFTIETREVMHSVFGLATVFICVMGYFILLGAEYLGVIQLLVYVGAVTVMMVFAIMLTRRKMVENRETGEVSSKTDEEVE